MSKRSNTAKRATERALAGKEESWADFRNFRHFNNDNVFVEYLANPILRKRRKRTA